MTASILAALLLLAPITPETAKFTIRQDGKTIGTEEFTIRSNDKGYIAEGKTQIAGDPTSVTSRMELDENLNVVSYEYKRGPATIKIKVQSPLSEIAIGGQGGETSTEFRFPDKGTILDNNFFHHYVILLYKVKALDQSFGIFVPQDMQVGSAHVRSTGKSTYALELGDVKLEATVDAAGKLTRLSMPSAKVVVER
jgi:hypothetical protein